MLRSRVLGRDYDVWDRVYLCIPPRNDLTPLIPGRLAPS